jgi:hypothetical protein
MLSSPASRSPNERSNWMTSRSWCCLDERNAIATELDPRDLLSASPAREMVRLGRFELPRTSSPRGANTDGDGDDERSGKLEDQRHGVL